MSDLLPALPSNTKWTGGEQLHIERPDWLDQASCLGVDPELFFPERGASTRDAKEVCARCPVRGDCLDYALANGEKHGIWGGLSERERRKLRSGRPGPHNAPAGLPGVIDERRRQVRSMARDLTQAEIARDLGLSRRTVQRYLEEAS